MYLYPVWIRLWHIVNAVLILLLILTGAMMLFTDNDNGLLISLFAASGRIHDSSAIILTVSYTVFVAGNIITGNGKYYRISRKDLLQGLWKQLRYFVWGMFRKEKPPFPVTMDDKFNPLEKITYFLIMYAALPLLIISGIIMLFPDMRIMDRLGASFFVFTNILHIILGFLMTIFLIIHIYVCTISPVPGSILRSIISGYRESEG